MKAQGKGYVDPDLFHLILGNIVEGVFTVDRQFRITFFNHAAEEITGYSSPEVLGEPCSEVFHTAICHTDCPLRRSLRTGKVEKNVEIDIQTRSGRSQTISVCTAPLVDSHGAFLGGVETFRDITSIRVLRRELSARCTLRDIVSKNQAMREIMDLLPGIAYSDAPVLIRGNRGTGKVRFANAIHNMSPRASGPMVEVSCSAAPASLLEPMLFGQVGKGPPGKQHGRLGRFHAAHQGTLYLDEIGRCPPPVQAKILRAMLKGKVEPVGSGQSTTVDVRILASTSQDLGRMVAKGRFLESLLKLLEQVTFRVLDLCDRTEDIPLLVEHCIERLNGTMGRRIQGISDEALAMLVCFPLRGNVRELESVLEHAYIVTQGPIITVQDLPPQLLTGPKSRPGDGARPVGPHAQAATAAAQGYTNASFSVNERQHLMDCLHRHHFSIPRAARELGMHRTTLWRKVKQLELPCPLRRRSGVSAGS